MIAVDRMRTIKGVAAVGPASLRIDWSNGVSADLDLGLLIGDRAFAALREPEAFAAVQVGDWGHSLAWPSGAELGADALLARTQSWNAIYATIVQLDGNKSFFTQSEVAQVRARYSNSLESKLNTLDQSDREILRLLAQGKSDKEIAATVYMANQTVRNRISRLFKSFDKRNRTELAVFLQQSGLYSFEGAA